MSFSEFIREKNVLDFYKTNVDSFAFQSDRWLFIHIPKTAGSSLREEIANVLQPDANLEVDYSSIDGSNRHADYRTKLELTMKQFVSSKQFHNYRFISGHVKLQDIRSFKEFNDCRLITMLRDPAERVISDYYWQISNNHPLSAQVRKSFPNLIDFARAPENQNIQFKYLCAKADMRPEDVFESIAKEFTFVGLQEMYWFSTCAIFSLLGKRASPSLRLRDGNASKSRPPLGDVSEIYKLNGLDSHLYNMLAPLLKARQGPFFDQYNYNRLHKALAGTLND